MKLFKTIIAAVAILTSTISFANNGDDTPVEAKKSTSKLLEFTVIKSDHIMHFNWMIAATANGDMFLIEKSEDNGEKWKEVSRIEPSEGHNGVREYNTSVMNTINSVNELYRIVQVKSDEERFELAQELITNPVVSKLQLISLGKKVTETVAVSFRTLESGKSKIDIVNTRGEVVASHPFIAIKGYNRVELDVKYNAAGKYKVVLQKEGVDKKMTKNLTLETTKFNKKSEY